MPCYAKNPEVVKREEDQNGALLFNPDTNQIRALNETGLLIWDLCDGSRDLDAFVQAIKENFDAIPPEVAEQIREFIDFMVSTDFIGVVET